MRFSSLENLMRRHFGARAEPVAEALVSSVAMQGFLNDLDAAQLARRRELVSEIKQVSGRYEQNCAEAAETLELAAREVAAARAALGAAQDRYMALASASASLSCQRDSKVGALTRALDDLADPRLELFACGCVDLYNSARHLAPKQGWQENHRGQARPYESYADLNIALNALLSVAMRARELKRQPHCFTDVTAQLTKWRGELAVLLEGAGGRAEELPHVDGSELVVDVAKLH